MINTQIPQPPLNEEDILMFLSQLCNYLAVLQTELITLNTKISNIEVLQKSLVNE